MSLKTYALPKAPRAFSIVHSHKCGHTITDPGTQLPQYTIRSCVGRFSPGDWVTYRHDQSKGMVVSVDDECIVVLWSIMPRWEEIMPPRRVAPSPLFARQMTSIQPMSIPRGSIFYLDYTYGGDAVLDKRCNEGPWHGRIYWKARRFVRCSKARIRSSLASLSSSLESQCGKRWSSIAGVVKMTIVTWVRMKVLPPR